MSEQKKSKKGCLKAAGLGLIGFIIGLLIGIALFDKALSALYSVVGEFSFWIALLFPPMAGICLSGLFAAIGGIVLVINQSR